MNTPEQNIIKTLKGKRVLFLENDLNLSDGVDEFARILKSSEIEYKVLADLSEIPLDEVVAEIQKCDAIVFMTQWLYDISKTLKDYVTKMDRKLIVVEVYISEPTWYYKSQHGTKHDVYIYSCQVHWGEADKTSETFYKLTNKPYWDYKNNFDK